MQVIVADADEHVGLRVGERRSESYSFFTLRARRLLRLFKHARHEGVVGDADDRTRSGHGHLLDSLFRV